MDKKLVIGVDFDGTIVSESFPHIEEDKINHKVVSLMKLAKEKGHLIIIWTARSGIYLDQAIEFLKREGVPFDYVNENPEDPFALRGEQGRKIFCHYYLDDRAVNVKDVDSLFGVI